MDYRKNGALTILLMAAMALFGCGGSGPVAPDANASQPSEIQHDPNLAYQAWVLCMDTSYSPMPEQFQKLKRVIKQSVRTDMRQNDLAWLIPIESGSRSPELFPMAPAGLKRSSRVGSGPRLQKSKERLDDAISKLDQRADWTDLKSPVELALSILQSEAGAQERYLLIGSDFVQDEAPGMMTLEPPSGADGISAAGVHAILLVTIPKNEYLKALGNISPAKLYQTVIQKWSDYFRRLGAVDTIVRLVDAIPVV